VRRLTAVLALYAFVMQAFLGGLAPLPMASAAALPFDIHCLDKFEEAGRTDPAAPHAPAHQHGCCCTAAQPIAGSPPPQPAMALVAWPPRRAVQLVWKMAAALPARAPPRTLASARAPPLV
jgi:hypothetical protein